MSSTSSTASQKRSFIEELRNNSFKWSIPPKKFTSEKSFAIFLHDFKIVYMCCENLAQLMYETTAAMDDTASLQLTTDPPKMAVSTVKVEPSIAAFGVGACKKDRVLSRSPL